jgi:membrane associated rhomboid family serine protease
MRKYVPVALVNLLWNAARRGRFPAIRRCPSCHSIMSSIPVPYKEFEIDVCTGCAAVWFGSGARGYREISTVPGAIAEPDSPTHRAATRHVEAALRRAQTAKTSPGRLWKHIPALIGLSVEPDAEESLCTPYATYVLLCLVFIVSIFGLAGVITPEQFGVVPAEWTRGGGLTVVSGFFIQGGLFPLAVNLHYLFMFGDNVEEVLGQVKFLTILTVSALAGSAIYVLSHLHSMEPCMGAAGGISGILTYYVLRFPKHHISLFGFFLHWLRFPVTFYFGLWVLLQLIGAAGGWGHATAAAHFGGMMTGLVWFLTELYAEMRR